MSNDLDRLKDSLSMLSIVELRRLRKQTVDWRVRAACCRRLWEKQRKRTEVGSTKAEQLSLFGER